MAIGHRGEYSGSIARQRPHPAPISSYARALARQLRAGLLVIVITACDAPTPSREGGPARPAEQDAFWAALAVHCGQAYRGAISDATPYYRTTLEGRAAVVHFVQCSDTLIHVAFHLDEDRSRNWILTRAEGTLRLKHDHRHEDGTEDVVSQYGGDAPVPGLATRQIFPADAHTAEILPTRRDNFWFLDFVNEATLEYGVHWPTLGHSVRFTFDVATPIAPPPLPWGYQPR